MSELKDFNGKDLKIGQRVADRLGDAGEGKIVTIYVGEHGTYKGKLLARIRWDSVGEGCGWPGSDLICA